MKKKKNVVPIYAIGIVWLVMAILKKIGFFGAILWSAAIYFFLKLFFKDKEVPKEEAKPAEPAQEPVQKAEPEQQPKPAAAGTEAAEVLQHGRRYAEKIRQLNDQIPDFKISAQLKQLEILTEKIFGFVRQHPEKAKEIKTFLNYYLPTTVKLLEQYVVLQDQGLRMGNIDEGMQKIEQMLDKVIVAFQKQLDSLFAADVVDITADIQVMEQMMASEGLTNNKDF